LFLWRLFLTEPLTAAALSICLATIFWCIVILRKRQRGPDRFLATLMGIISVWQGLRLLRSAGLLTGSNQIDTVAEFTVTALYLISVLILRILVTERQNTQVRLRLVESSGPAKVERLLQPRTVSDLILDANPLATVAVDNAGLVAYWNSAAERLLGWSAKDTLGKASPVAANATVRTKAGANVPVECWVSTLHDSSGRSCGTVLMFASRREHEEPPSGPGIAVNMLACARG
jgi:PAS domain-containing protein